LLTIMEKTSANRIPPGNGGCPSSSFLLLKRFEPGQQVRLAFPSGWFAGSRFRIRLFQGFSKGIEVSPSVAIGGIQVGMPQPISDDSGIDSRRKEANPSCVAEQMRGNTLL
jgi:hypothetical protein